jgi:hypothetical protein
MLVIPALGRLRKEGSKFEGSMGYRVRLLRERERERERERRKRRRRKRKGRKEERKEGRKTERPLLFHRAVLGRSMMSPWDF